MPELYISRLLTKKEISAIMGSYDRIEPFKGIKPDIRQDITGTYIVMWERPGESYMFTCKTLSLSIDKWNQFVFVYNVGWDRIKEHYDMTDPEWYQSAVRRK